MLFRLSCLVALLQFFSLASAAYSIEEIIARQSSNATGDQKCSNYMCVAGTLNGSTVQYVLSSTGRMTPGWMGVGFGTQMAGSSMVILWNNSDSSITISQRKATGESEPPVDNNPSSIATLSNDLSSTTGNTKFTFTMDAPSNTKQNIIFAIGATDSNPQSSAKDAQLDQHYDFAISTLDLSKTLTSSPGSGSSGDSSPDTVIDTIPLLPYQKWIIAHGVLAVVGYLFFLPIGALLARYLRTFTVVWFKGHWIIQFGLGGIMIVLSFVCGVEAVNKVGARHFDDDHKKWGLAIFILYFAQCSIGYIIHKFKRRKPGRPLQNYFHAVFGLLIIGLAMYQVRSGYHDEWPRTAGRGNLPNSVNIVWFVWIIFLIVLYAVGLGFLPRQWKQEAATRK